MTILLTTILTTDNWLHKTKALRGLVIHHAFSNLSCSLTE